MQEAGRRPPTDLSATTELPVTGSGRRWVRFTLHYVEMVVAMLAGMLLLGGALRVALAATGVDYSMERLPELVILEMGLSMALVMVAWMRFRGHGWVSTVEMAGAMLAPAVTVIPLVWLGGLDGGVAMVLEHGTMFALMLAVMLRRRAEFSAAHPWRRRTTPAPHRRLLPALGHAGIALFAFLLVPAAVYAVGSSAYERSRYAQPEPAAATAAAIAETAPPPYDPGKPTAVVVVGNSGANIADTLVPYEILATTGAFNVYTVAPERRLVTLLGGVDLIPDFSFAQLRELLDGSAPEVTVVPELPDTDEASDARVAAWLRETAREGTVLGVCTGARLVAEAGLLDGRDATSHWYRLDELERDHPGVNWRRGNRYLDDGDVITTGGLLSSVDGTLRVVERFVDTDAAAAAARTIGWAHYSPGAPAALPVARLTVANAAVHLLNLGFRANDTTMGVVLTDGVGELELAAAFAPYAEVKSARTLALASGGGVVRTRHGLTVVPRADLDAVDRADWLLVPGRGAAASPDPEVAAAAGRAGVPVAYLHREAGFAFDPVLRHMASTLDVPTAAWTAKILEYPAAQWEWSGPGWPWTPMLRPFLLGLAGLAAALAVRAASGRFLRMTAPLDRGQGRG